MNNINRKLLSFVALTMVSSCLTAAEKKIAWVEIHTDKKKEANHKEMQRTDSLSRRAISTPLLMVQKAYLKSPKVKPNSITPKPLSVDEDVIFVEQEPVQSPRQIKNEEQGKQVHVHPFMIDAQDSSDNETDQKANGRVTEKQEQQTLDLRVQARQILAEQNYYTRYYPRWGKLAEIDMQYAQGVSTKEGPACPICLGTINEPRCLPCGHVFCTECVSPWIRTKNSCPQCRKQVYQMRSESDVSPVNIINNIRLLPASTQQSTFLEELRSAQLIAEITKPCPRCGIRIEKTGGCRHMTCPQEEGGCGHEFYWCCLGRYPYHAITCELLLAIQNQVTRPNITCRQASRHDCCTIL